MLQILFVRKSNLWHNFQRIHQLHSKGDEGVDSQDKAGLLGTIGDDDLQLVHLNADQLVVNAEELQVLGLKDCEKILTKKIILDT